MSSSDDPPTAPSAEQPRVLFVYFTYTQQSLKVVEAMADVLRERGREVRQAAIELTDKRWAERFTRFRRHAYLDIFGMMPAQLRGATGEIAVYDADGAGAVDAALANAVKKSVAQIDELSAKNLKAGLAEAQAGMGG